MEDEDRPDPQNRGVRLALNVEIDTIAGAKVATNVTR